MLLCLVADLANIWAQWVSSYIRSYTYGYAIAKELVFKWHSGNHCPSRAQPNRRRKSHLSSLDPPKTWNIQVQYMAISGASGPTNSLSRGKWLSVTLYLAKPSLYSMPRIDDRSMNGSRLDCKIGGNREISINYHPLAAVHTTIPTLHNIL